MNSTVNVSLRELKFTIGRALHAAGVEGGAVNPVRDTLVDAAALGVDVLGVLLETLDQPPAVSGRIEWVREGNRIEVDGLGQPSFLVAPAIMDLGIAAVEKDGAVLVVVRNTNHNEAFAGLSGRVALHCVELTSVSAASISSIATTLGQPLGHPLGIPTSPDPETASAPVAAFLFSRGVRTTDALAPRDRAGVHIARMLSDGYDTSAEVWWRTFDFSNEALTPDSDLSRRHAGASVLDESGRIVGEVGEDDDYPGVSETIREFTRP